MASSVAIMKTIITFMTVALQMVSAFVPPSRIGGGRGSTSLSMGLTLYGSPGSRSPLVNWAAIELGVELSPGDLSQNPHPFKQIPCLTDGDAVLFESGAILLYVLDYAMSLGSATATLDPKNKAAVTSWIVWANASLDPICFKETPDGKVYDTGLKNPNRRIDVLNTLLSNQQYLLKDGFSTADVAVASYLLYVLQFFPDVNWAERWPHVARYARDCAAREGYGKAFGGRVQGYLVGALDEMMKGGGGKKLFGLF